MRVLFIGDVTGKPGRRIVAARLGPLRREHRIDVVIANGENAAGGMGLTADVAAELFAAGVDVLTGGNHVWKNRDAYELLDSDPRVLRPANYPAGAPGRGAAVLRTGGLEIGVLNLEGRVFMQTLDDPFRLGRSAHKLCYSLPGVQALEKDAVRRLGYGHLHAQLLGHLDRGGGGIHPFRHVLH